VAVVLQLETIGNKDWYEWGSNLLVANQRADGLWVGAYGENGKGVADTCFALLFLKRANFAKDLSNLLKGRVQDPGRVVLKAGSGGDSIRVSPGDSNAAMPAIKSASPRNPLNDPLVGKPAAGYLGNSTSAKLAEALLDMSPDRQEAEIERLRDQKGGDNTEALAIAIPYLPIDSRRKAREALADREARMSAKTVSLDLQDENSEIRRAAVLACALKGFKQHVPQLITLLGDREQVVARAAYAALKELSGQDFGPSVNADDSERRRAVADWQDWWKKQTP
jgi:hypothetical protein